MENAKLEARVVQSARGWIGTPYVHQASTVGAGADCLGLIRGVWRDVIGHEPEPLPPYTSDWSEASGQEVLAEAALRWLWVREGAALCLGDVLLFRMRPTAVAKHLGIVSDLGEVPRFIHAYTGHGVVESALSKPWRTKISAVFHFPSKG